MAIRKDVKSVNIVDYQMPVAENIESINNCIDNPTTLSNYSNISSSEIEYVDFSLDNNKILP